MPLEAPVINAVAGFMTSPWFELIEWIVGWYAFDIRGTLA